MMPLSCYDVGRGPSSDTVAVFFKLPVSRVISPPKFIFFKKITQAMACGYNYRKHTLYLLLCFLVNVSIETLRDINIDLKNLFRASEMSQWINDLSFSPRIDVVEGED